MRRLETNQWNSSPSSTIEREVALVLDKIDRTHTLHENLERSLTRSECSIGSDLMNLTPHDSGYVSYQIDPREKLLNRKLHERLRTRMQGIEVERRRLVQTKAEKLHALRSELLGLMERHQLVSDENSS